ncbi:hypothetical protein M2277_002350 [Paenibacillus sp. LBL]|uniref:hypothetical protein n=1 Tax=Paenibacillus sp. LBL TaxID=2940563 RepID=UPI0024765789|nr:hypothetical protein [Paenibacillus sp. LBL]MDH6671688.1 hypothetical protein [Paenibacillus sp. LBL]
MLMYFSEISNIYIHVKWFTDNFEWVPLPFPRVVTLTFLFWLAFTLFVLLVSSVFNDPLGKTRPVERIHQFLHRLRPHTEVILRIGLAIGLVLQLLSGSYLAPEFRTNSMWIILGLSAAAACLLYQRTLPISGAILFLLYIQASLNYGIFHSIDYLIYIGIVYYLFVCGTPLKKTAAPVMYVCTGMSLAWLAMEKLTIPELACSVMGSYGLPTFGFSIEHFVMISAFIEIGLAWAFIVGIMSRFTALLVSGIFIMTSLVFGYKEVIGHTIIHTLLILFLIEGTGDLRTPFQFHRSPVLRGLFVSVNFCLFLFSLMALYIWMGKTL